MKKIYSFIILTVMAFSFAACSSDDNVGGQYLKENTVKIVKSDVSFSAKASTGAVEFTAPAGATVKLNSTWATAAVDGNKVTVATEGVIDTETASNLSATLLELDYSNLDLTLDFDKTDYITSAGLRVLLVARKKLTDDTMRIINVNEPIELVFKVTGFSDMPYEFQSASEKEGERRQGFRF